MNGHDPIHIQVSMPRISGATISGAGTVTVDRAEGPDFAAMIRGAGTIDLPALHTDRARFEMGGAGKISAAGNAGSVDAQVRGVGAIELAGLAARAGKLNMSGTGSIKARVDGPADATMNGMGSVEVVGNAALHDSQERARFGPLRRLRRQRRRETMSRHDPTRRRRGRPDRRRRGPGRRTQFPDRGRFPRRVEQHAVRRLCPYRQGAGHPCQRQPTKRSTGWRSGTRGGELRIGSKSGSWFSGWHWASGQHARAST